MRRFAVLIVAAALSTFLIPTELVSAVSLPSQAADEATEHTHGPDGIGLDPRGRRSEAALAVDDALAPSWQGDTFIGPGSGVTDAPDPADLVGKPQVHLVYIYPKDKPSRYATFAKMFQADARAASKLLDTLYGRKIRFDEQASNAVPRHLDITELKSRYTAKQLAGGQQFNHVHDDLTRAYPNASKKYVAWLDAGSRYCGQGHLYQDTQRTTSNANNVNRTTGIVYRPYDANDQTTGGFCRGRTFLHELGHNLGAVQRVAPSAFDGAHCNDDDNDVMCYAAQSPLASTTAQFDFGNNDYWDRGAVRPVQGEDQSWTTGYPSAPEKLPWWSVSLSLYLCPPQAGSANGGICSQPNNAGY